MTDQQRLRSHPAYRELLARYRAARHEWARGSPAFYAAARANEVSERVFCDRVVGGPVPIAWAASSTHEPFIDRRHLDLAFEDAGGEGP